MTDSPDGLGERLRDEAKVRESAGHPAGTRLAHEAALFREAADRIDTLTEQVAEAWALGAGAARQDGARIAAEHVVLTRANEALLSENARLTEQVRGAERVVEAGRFVLETDAGPVNPMDNNHVVGAGAMADLQRAIDVYHDAALSIYDEVAAGVKSVTEEKKS